VHEFIFEHLYIFSFYAIFLLNILDITDESCILGALFYFLYNA